jgi:hypothetical protein
MVPGPCNERHFEQDIHLLVLAMCCEKSWSIVYMSPAVNQFTCDRRNVIVTIGGLDKFM